MKWWERCIDGSSHAYLLVLPDPEQYEDCECSLVFSLDTPKLGYDSLDFANCPLDVGSDKFRIGIVVSRLALSLHIDEQLPEIPYLPGKPGQHVLI